MRKRKSYRNLGFILLALMSTIAMNNCDNVHLSLATPVQTNSLSKAVPEICALPPTVAERNTKILFLVDMSGSNKFGNFGSGTGTDPDKTFRTKLIKDFVDSHASNDQIYYGFIGFQESIARAYINDGSDQSPIFTNDVTKVYDAIQRFNTDPDGDATPYKAAMTLGISAIDTDRKHQNQVLGQDVQSMYSVVLLSDGVPTDYDSTSVPGTIDDAAIDRDVVSLILTAGQATLSTVYYGPFANANDQGAAGRLERMANLGKGKFSNVNTDGKVPLEQIIAFKDGDPWVMRKFFVTNLTSAPCDDGTIDVDSDADGVCDKDEIRYNTQFKSDATFAARMNGKKFDPAKRNSFGNAFNDYINYRRIVYGENIDEACQKYTDPDGDLLNDCEEGYLRALSPSGPTSDWTTHMGSDGDNNNFDSDGDGFIDYIELIYGRSRSAALDFNSSQNLINGYRMDDILNQHLNPIKPDKAQSYEVEFRFTRVNERGQNCYSYNQKSLPLFKTLELTAGNAPGATQLAHKAGENVILIYTIQSRESDPNGTGILFTNYQKIPFGTTGDMVDVGKLDFKAYTSTNARSHAK